MRHLYIPTNTAEPTTLPEGSQTLHLQGSSMGTTWRVQLIGKTNLTADMLQQGLQYQLDQVDRQMSTWDINSDLCRFNRAAAGTWCRLPEAFCQVVDYAIYLARQTAGAYDPAAGKLVDLWGFGPQPRSSAFPNAARIMQAMAGHGWRDLQFERHAARLFQPGGVSLDFSSIAKGYAVDQLARFLDAQDVPSYLIEVGGELRGRGIKQDHSPWWIRIEQADGQSSTDKTAHESESGSEHLIALHELSIATSGNYRQFFDHEGRRYSHTIDSRTGYPVDNKLVSVSVLHRECMIADALATAFTVMGYENAIAYANQHEIAALFTQQQNNTISETRSRAMSVMLEE